VRGGGGRWWLRGSSRRRQAESVWVRRSRCRGRFRYQRGMAQCRPGWFFIFFILWPLPYLARFVEGEAAEVGEQSPTHAGGCREMAVSKGV
jgi:hypothetical protein